VNKSVSLTVTRDIFKTQGAFTISRGSRTQVSVLTVTLSCEGKTGVGECVPYARYGETTESVERQILSQRTALQNGMDRQLLQTALPAGAARNALDCALWDLESKIKQVPVWALAGLTEPKALTTAYTLSLESPEAMRESARAHAHRPLLKLKLGGDGDMQRLQAVREGAPDAQLIVDANEGWSAADYDTLAPVMVSLGVTLVEQPLPADNDDALCDRQRPLPVCADEACHDRASLAALAGKYDVVNIKLDKTGGLSEALALRHAAEQAGFGVMVGCMVGSSLAMAPALLVAQDVDYVDLDGPLLLAEDRSTPMKFEGSVVYPAATTLWG